MIAKLFFPLSLFKLFNLSIPIYTLRIYSHVCTRINLRHLSPSLPRFHRYFSIPVKISMALSRSAGDDAQPHWLIALQRGHGRIELIRREVATAQSAMSKLSIVGGSFQPRYLRSAAHLRGRDWPEAVSG